MKLIEIQTEALPIADPLGPSGTEGDVLSRRVLLRSSSNLSGEAREEIQWHGIESSAFYLPRSWQVTAGQAPLGFICNVVCKHRIVIRISLEHGHKDVANEFVLLGRIPQNHRSSASDIVGCELIEHPLEGNQHKNDPDAIGVCDRCGCIYIAKDISIKSSGTSIGVIRYAGAAIEEHKPARHVHSGRLHRLERSAQCLTRKWLWWRRWRRISRSNAVCSPCVPAEIPAALYPWKVRSEQPPDITVDVDAGRSSQIGFGV